MDITEASVSILFVKFSACLIAAGLSFFLFHWMRNRFRDKIDGEPVLIEKALVHDKSDHGTRYNHCYLIHFYVPARDDVVTCEVPFEIWRDREMKTWGTLTHQGGMFYSFETQDALYCEEALYHPEARY